MLPYVCERIVTIIASIFVVLFFVIISIPHFFKLSLEARYRIGVLSVIVLFIFCFPWTKQDVSERKLFPFEDQTVSNWMKENKWQNYLELVAVNAGDEQRDLSALDITDIDRLIDLPEEVKTQLKKAVQYATEKKRLNLWLHVEYRIPPFVIQRLNKIGITTLEALSMMTTKQVEFDLVGNDMDVYSMLLKAIRAAGTANPDVKMLTYYNEVQDHSFGFKLFIIILTFMIGGTLLILIMVAECVQSVFAIPNRLLSRRPVSIHPGTTGIPSGNTGSSKGWLWNWLTGEGISTQNCTVEWKWTEPQVVGQTMTFIVKLFKKNGRPYLLKDTSSVTIEILHKGDKVACTKDTQPYSNLLQVQFTVHRSGMYKIHVLVKGTPIRNSPFTKIFDADVIDASRTGFSNYCSTVVCTVGQSYPLVIETRDCYDNPALYKTDHQNYFKIKVIESESNVRYVPATQIIHNPVNKQLVMHIKMESEGCFQASVSYGDVKLRNGDFNILVINGDDLETVNKTVSKKSHNIWYEARLLSDGVHSDEKAKKVYVYISPKQLTVKEYLFKIIGKKLHTWRVCPSTKFSFVGYNHKYEAPVLKIYDCSQHPVILATKDRSLIAATFTNFLLRNIGGSETFQDKRIFFFQEVKRLSKKGNVTLKIDRANLLLSSYKACKSLYSSDWFKTFSIEFVNELGLDWGGLRREWVQVLCTELFDPDRSGLFTRFTEHSQGLIHPKYNAGVKLKYYELAGKLVGKCLLETSAGASTQMFIKAKFTRSFLAQIIGLQVNYKYFETDDPDLYKSKIKFIEENSIEGMDLTFSEDEYVDGQLSKTVDLIQNGSKIEVTEQNKIQYLNCLAQYKLASCVKEEVECFLKGLNSLISDNLLSIFDENELELLMCGTDNYSIADFKLYAQVSQDLGSQLIGWFWAIVASFTDEQMARLLQFTTGSSQLPPEGFKDLDPKFTISYTSYSVNSLPTAHTCFNQLCLPNYTTMENMHKSLMTAINEGFQGFGFV